MTRIYPKFMSQKIKNAVIRQVQRLYETGKLIQGRRHDGHGGRCVLGVIENIGFEMQVQVTKVTQFKRYRPWANAIVKVNDLGFKGKDLDKIYENRGNDEELTFPLVPPSNYAELMLILKDSPVEEEK